MTTVLVVEDEALIADDIQRTLIRLGYDVPTTASTGEKALAATDRLKPELVLMDIKLRGSMDGIEAATEIQSRFDIPIVYLTSHSDETTLARAKATNPHGYLLKPFSDRELRTAIEVALHRHELECRLAERKQLEARLVQTERLASLGTMAAGVAHEINNPLTYVITNIHVSVEGLQRAIAMVGLAEPGDRIVAQLAELQEALRDAAGGAERVRLIVQDLRKFSRGDDRGTTALALRDAIEVAIKMTAHAVSQHVQVRTELGVTPLVDADSGAIGQVFTNLLLNAARAVGDGHAGTSEIVVTTYTDPEGNAVVEVRDTGPGIAADVLARIFDPFFTTKAVGSGMGLGLAICHSIVSNLAGQIVAESPQGGGALFRVTLPPSHRRGEADEAPPVAASSGRRGTVLVIDDEKAVGIAMGRTLRTEHEVTVEQDARQAIASIAAGATFDVIFCDLMMPSISGIEVYEAIAAFNPAQANRIVFMTGGAFSEKAETFLADLTNARVTKPFTAETIRAIARRHVDLP